MDIVSFIYLFIFGIILGSFINVCALRYGTGMSASKGRSMCFSCGRPLAWYDLVPILSFFFLLGKCRHCKAPISWQYPVVEFVTGFLFVGLFIRQYFYFPLYSSFGHGLLYSSLFLVYYTLVFSILLIITIYDIRHKIIPDRLVYTFIGLAVAKLLFYFFYVSGMPYSLGDYLDISAPLILSVPFGLIWYFSRGRLIGFGDIKLMFGMGALLGCVLGVSAVVLAFWIGAVWAIFLLVVQWFQKQRNIVTMNSEIPFAPFLILATLIVFFTHLDLFGLDQLLQLL